MDFIIFFSSSLCQDQDTQALKEHLIDELDYVLMPTEAWNKLVSWYSCLDGQRPIVRKVRQVNMLDQFVPFQNHSSEHILDFPGH